MDVLAVDLGRELREFVESSLVLAPVVRRAPVVGQLLEVAERYAALPSRPGKLARPARGGEPPVEVVEVGLGDVDPVRADPWGLSS
jgi:hypothetical protein